MSIPQDKETLINTLVVNYQKLQTELKSIPSEFTHVKELEGHAKNTQMSIHNLVAYLLGWGELVLKWDDQKSKGMEVDFPETGFKWNQLGHLAQKFYKDYEKLDFATLLSQLDGNQKQILELIDRKTNAELYETAWYDRYTLGRMIQLNTASPYKNAMNRIRKWKKKREFN